MNTNQKWKETLHECWKNKNFMIGFFILVSVILVALLADVISPYDYTEQAVGPRFQAPCAKFVFGTDDLGRDMLSRIIHGSRITLWVAFLGASLQLVIGVVVGLACGFFGKWVDLVHSRNNPCIGSCYDFRKRFDEHDYSNLSGCMGKLCTYRQSKDAFP